jgi:hypothetical protein
MKIIITENQYINLLLEGATTPPEIVKQKYEQAKVLSKIYTKPKDLFNYDPKLYKFLITRNLLVNIYPNMGRRAFIPKGVDSQEEDNRKVVADKIDYVKRIASYYKTPEQFAFEHPRLYQFMNNNKFRKDVFPEAFSKKNYKLDMELYHAIRALKYFYGTKKQFQEMYPNEYTYLTKNYHHDLIDKYLPQYNKKYLELFSDVIFSEEIAKAQKYKNFLELEKNDEELFIKLKQMGLLDKIYKHDIKTQRLIDLARTYEKEYLLLTNNPELYIKIKKLGLMDEVFFKN